MPISKNKRPKLTPKPNLFQRNEKKIEKPGPSEKNMNPDTTESLLEIIKKIRKENEELKMDLKCLRGNQEQASAAPSRVKEQARKIEEAQTSKLPLLNRLKIISSNVNSLISNARRTNLTELLKELNPDIVLINETKLNPKHKISLKDYNIIRQDRPEANQAGGTAIIIKKHFKFTEIILPNLSDDPLIETTIVKINMKRHEHLFIIAAYAPGNNKTEFQEEFPKIFKHLCSVNFVEYNC
ncbi:hypothetical protein KPH14_012655, partial [Odynerus spinipes]